MLLTAILSYLIGSISTSTILTRLIAKTDIRSHGSGNAGATNTARVLGTKWGIAVLIIDALKGVIAVLLTRAFVHDQSAALYLSGLAVVAGHNWPVFFGFRGGKGIATTIGVFLSIHTILEPALLGGAIAIILLLITRFVSLASLCFTIFTAVLCLCLGRPLMAFVFSAIVAIFSLYRHRQNIVRLVKGQEHRLFSKS